MVKAASPAVGFNDNVRRRNRNFHVQTEDSGVAHPHIITHLFTDGGRIIKSEKQSYADALGDEELAKKVRERMRAQHVGMLEALKRGEFDLLVWGNRPAKGPGSAPGSTGAPSSSSLDVPVSVAAPASLAAPPVAASAPAAASMSAPEPTAAPAPVRRTDRGLAAAASAAAAASPPVPQPPISSTALPHVEPPPRVDAPPRKTMPRLEAVTLPRATPTKLRRSSRPPPRGRQQPPSSGSNPREGLLTQSLDEVILSLLGDD